MSMPRSANAAHSFRTSVGELLDRSTYTLPERIESMSPSGDITTLSTSGGPGNDVKMISASWAASATLAARRAVGVRVSSATASARRSKAATEWPASATCRAMCCPMCPSPMKPTCIACVSRCLQHLEIAFGEEPRPVGLTHEFIGVASDADGHRTVANLIEHHQVARRDGAIAQYLDDCVRNRVLAFQLRPGRQFSVRDPFEDRRATSSLAKRTVLGEGLAELIKAPIVEKLAEPGQCVPNFIRVRHRCTS